LEFEKDGFEEGVGGGLEEELGGLFGAFGAEEAVVSKYCEWFFKVFHVHELFWGDCG
jgi:hypothetical protein